MNFRKWTEEEDKILLERRLAGEAWAAIGRVLDIPYETCKYRFEKYLNPNSRHVRKRHLVREEPTEIVLKFDKKIKLDVQYEDDPRADKRSPYDWRTGWMERRSQARGEYDWGLNPVMPRRF